MRALLRGLLIVAMLVALGACAGAGGNGYAGSKSDKTKRAAELQVQLAQEYLKRGNLEVARDKLARALELDPYSAQAHTVSGFLNETISDFVQAELHYRRAVEIKPKDGDMSNNFASFLCRRGRYPEAEAMFRQALSDPYYKTPEVALANAGICAKDGGNLELAETYLRDALARKADYPGALLPMASVLHARGDFLKARAFMQRYDAAQPASPEALYLGYQIETALGDKRSAEDYRRRLTSSFPRSREAQSLEQGQ
ncbi:MAG: type IV pilus biogenesis/stability protein PilW [Lysobacterales bacterium]